MIGKNCPFLENVAKTVTTLKKAKTSAPKLNLKVKNIHVKIPLET
jgi:hypothetical protein